VCAALPSGGFEVRGVAFDAGAHSLQVTLGGQHVRHSPMSLLVRDG